ncbi:MAG TPA: PQQ-binding-like beta-propeller repeat protein [Candidatus Acidoferrales bacterium]|nr:PQQ-binding-like beta-propeller repeat protein [Candidatus Acidoferrales bacterium]
MDSVNRLRSHPVKVFLSIAFLIFFVPQPSRCQNYDWPQFNFDPQHSGNDTKETKITRQNVGSLHQLFKISLPSVADGAPAYLSDVQTPGGKLDMIFVTAKDGHIIALNAASGDVIWSHQYGTGNYRINNRSNPTYTTSSPAIDPDRTFVYSYGLDGYVHKYRITDGEETKNGGWPELCTLKPFDEKGSSALAVATAKDDSSYLYVANGGYLGDHGDYQGHLTTINLHDGTQHVFDANGSDQNVHFVERPGTPDWPAVQTAIWARAGVVYDATLDKIYMATGNGPFDPKDHNWGDTVFSLNPDGTGSDGNPVDSYTPTNFEDLDREDLDLGSTAPAIIPTPDNCSVKHLAVQGGKDKVLRLINLSDLSGRGGAGNVGGEIGRLVDIPSGEMVFTAPAVWVDPQDKASWIFVGTYFGLAAYRLQVDAEGTPGLKLVWKQSDGSSSPIIANGVLYCAVSGSIRAIDPVSGKILWRDEHLGKIHWESPIVDNGVLYITDESGHLTAYGL